MASLQELREAIKAEFSSRLLGGNPVLTNSNFDIMADYIGFLQFANEKGIEGVKSTLTPVTAVGDLLDEWGATFGVSRLTATRAQGEVRITGNIGTTLPEGTLLTRCDGIEYQTLAELTLTADTGKVAVEAIETGPNGNFQSGGALDLGSVTSGIASTAISLGMTGGSDVECDEDFRLRVLSAIRNPCRTGTVEDYEYWTRLYPGATRVCVVPLANGPGTVKIYFLMDGSYPNGIPAIGDVKAVYENIFGPNGPAPLGVVGDVCAPKPEPIDVAVTGVGEISTEQFSLIRATLEEAFLDFYDCENSEVCRADIEIALRSLLPACFKLVTPEDNVQIGSGSVPILGSLSIA